ncbi:MAG TPA: sodium:calcium antiporter [Chloroflexota bacterium]
MRSWLPVVLAAGLALPWMVLRLAGYHGPPPIIALLSGLAIVGAAFLLSWAAEVAQLEISQALAVAVLSLIAILPEYAVDMYFAYRAAQDPTYAPYAVANMTGANRLLIGVGWSLVVFLFWWRTRQRAVQLHEDEGLELGTMGLATLYAFTIPLKGYISLLDAAVLVGLFGLYAWSTSRHPPEEPELVGPAATIGRLPRGPRRAATVALFLYAAVAILASAEPFAEGLVESGKLLRIDEFLLVQWLAPLASETPEFIVVTLFVLRGFPNLGLRAMLSSKVNQWSLLVGMLPLVYTVGLGHVAPLPLDARQVEEVLLTAAQSIFAVALLANRSFSLGGALLLFVLFALQLVFPETRHIMTLVYLGLTAALLLGDRKRLVNFVRLPRHLFEPITGRRYPEQ